jgi:hypothetical protein
MNLSKFEEVALIWSEIVGSDVVDCYLDSSRRSLNAR